MKHRIGINVYEAANERIDYIFKNFERVYVSFSGGKDSGVMLNLCLDYMRRNNVTRKLGIPEYITRMAWKELTEEQRNAANDQAQQVITLWLTRYRTI